MKMVDRTDTLLAMMRDGFKEIRWLLQEGRTEQAVSLVDAFHNIPEFALIPHMLGVEYFVEIFEAHKKRHKGHMFNYIECLKSLPPDGAGGDPFADS